MLPGFPAPASGLRRMAPPIMQLGMVDMEKPRTNGKEGGVRYVVEPLNEGSDHVKQKPKRPRRLQGTRSPRPTGSSRWSARAAATQALLAVEGGAHGSLALADSLRRGDVVDPRERGLATELVYGVLRWRMRLDAALSPYVKQGLTNLEPVAQELLRIGAYQILLLDRIPSPIAVSATLDAARTLGAGRITGLLNGVLRRVAENGESLPDGADDCSIALRASMPEWIVRALRETYGPKNLSEEVLALKSRAPTTVRPTHARGGSAAARSALEEAGFQVEDGGHGTLSITGPGDPFGIQGFDSGLYTPQDPASLAVVEGMELTPHDVVLDLCAGRGVKTTAIADLGARVLACDISERKLADAVKLATKLGVIERVRTQAIDATNPPEDLGTYSHVLVDAPCTGLGTLRRHPEIAWRRQESDVDTLAKTQRAMLEAAAPHVAPGGALTFAVCSFHPREMPDLELNGFTLEHFEPPVRPSDGGDLFQLKRWRRRQEIPQAGGKDALGDVTS